MRFFSAIVLIGTLTVPSVDAHAGEIDTDHLFAFSQGTDIGEVGTKELESDTNGRFGKRDGRYAAYSQEIEVGYIPIKNLHVFAGGSLAYFDIADVPELDDRQRLSFEELEIEVRYRLMDRNPAGPRSTRQAASQSTATVPPLQFWPTKSLLRTWSCPSSISSTNPKLPAKTDPGRENRLWRLAGRC
ncbi:MAG: hypothetical protein K8F92_04720 [Hyphomicrobium sp.]|uniref:hypothetical protein n=1 Tax=Hyphomicrobium sp. TaxID=82 RepID=UPI00132988EB|nr:hypothetical protein [Hyphomicrobium sp.]KAB2943604.1 MAG: hypothetical protein F9K20_02780 [Hyphomicrobium sp.]MBZ0208938.1 hypothetical protein [Hyphomicrobium sp.]